MKNNINRESIGKLKKDKNAIILAHYYVDGQVQELADYVGDSYYLSQVALESDKDTIIFCGVKFMAESAKILSPHKTIIMPDNDADCPMAHMVTPSEIEKAREDYDDLAVVCYINSTAEIKALSDVCVTSSNAVKIIRSLNEENIFFVPDKNLAQYVASQVPEKNIFTNDGYCYVHNKIAKDQVSTALRSIPDAKVIVHPECSFQIIEMADFVGSTSSIIDYISKSNDKNFIICTESGILHQLHKRNPDKNFHFLSNNQICTDMKKITPKDVYNSLLSLKPGVEVELDISTKAKRALEKMHQLA